MTDDSDNRGRERSSLFLEARAYRRRRAADALRFLPVLGALLFLMPLIWWREGDTAPTSAAILAYVFVVWVALIGLAFVLSRYLPFSDRSGKSSAKSDEDGS